jgi:hypothetical protein
MDNIETKHETQQACDNFVLLDREYEVRLDYYSAKRKKRNPDDCDLSSSFSFSFESHEEREALVFFEKMCSATTMDSNECTRFHAIVLVEINTYETSSKEKVLKHHIILETLGTRITYAQAERILLDANEGLFNSMEEVLSE